jgi:hypothetical protein
VEVADQGGGGEFACNHKGVPRISTSVIMMTPASPTTSIRQVLGALFIGLVLGSLVGARGIVHAGEGMPDGPARDLTLRLGTSLLPIAQTLHLTAPWDAAEAALGRSPQPAVPPLLATAASRATTSHSQSLNRQRTKRTHFPRQSLTKRTHSAGSPGHTLGSLAHRVRYPLRRLTPAAPLRLLVTGDSLTEFLGPQLIQDAAQTGPVKGWVDTHYGTGLARPDFVDWSMVARQQVTTYHPEAVVVLMGGNDFQNMTLPNGAFFRAATPAWTREYQRRAAICLRVWRQGGVRRVYWLSIPPARDRAWAYADSRINVALRRAAKEVPGTEFLNILGPITDHGLYTDYVNRNGQPVLVRTPDGVHLTTAGAAIVAGQIINVLKHEWGLGARPRT